MNLNILKKVRICGFFAEKHKINEKIIKYEFNIVLILRIL